MNTPTSARERHDRTLRIVLPIVVLALGLSLWALVVWIGNIPPYVLPSPELILETLVSDWTLLFQSLLVTLATTVEGFLLAAVGGVGLAVLFNQSRLVEHSLYPYAVILQVTPIVAIAPLLLIYLPQPLAVLACAWIVAFFPVLANTTLGLRSVDRNLADLFSLYGASRSQVLWNLKLPSPLPYILGGLLGACLPHRRIRLSAEHPAHVCSAAAALHRRHRDLLSALGDQLSGAAPLARKRAGAGTLAVRSAARPPPRRARHGLRRARRRRGSDAGTTCRQRR